jgi:hypothetical protein
LPLHSTRTFAAAAAAAAAGLSARGCCASLAAAGVMGAACTVASTAACGVVYPTIWTICNGDGSEAGAGISVAWEMDMLLHLASGG